uniref:Uncharacterized protein n=1 Tax=Babesia orientalis TaxID=273649 RepID=A0A0M4NEZ0_9APIC|nr:hypothetical protein [Babesia orientalis]YP_009170358.1 hypothetical protein [Babesia orientalis]YP_009170359.1 hypothetical protein [Babesia orientalis]YP_009170361.1 hypothetical protein [Babesia orientalis]ALE29355.1 hypothetical protein [Babesia orientalis]ALE29356.1 hypothetical protein [Babesia orientalis]ALE29357.1 hypothetical protein [Babesia orientalis]ALE29359.1 hypothetical protein [Babesia orientalis]
MFYDSSAAERAKEILNPIALKIKYIVDIIADCLLYVLEYLKSHLDNYLSEYRLSTKQIILCKLYGVLYAFIQITTIYICLPFHIFSKLYMTCIFSTLSTLIEMKIISQKKIKNKKHMLKLFLDKYYF